MVTLFGVERLLRIAPSWNRLCFAIINQFPIYGHEKYKWTGCFRSQYAIIVGKYVLYQYFKWVETGHELLVWQHMNAMQTHTYTVCPVKYAPGFIVLCFIVIMSSVFLWLTWFIQEDCFIGTWQSIWLQLLMIWVIIQTNKAHRVYFLGSIRHGSNISWFDMPQ